MEWTELKPDVAPGDLAKVLRSMDCATAIRFHLNLRSGTRLYISPACAARVLSHVRSDNKEVGGLLLGRVWESNKICGSVSPPIVVVVESFASEVYRNSSVSLEMGTEIWNRVNCDAKSNSIVVGWYHSHPNLGAFFSGTDRRTQRSFFNNPYSIGWVIDPFRDEEKVFVGANSEEYQGKLVVLNHDLEMAETS